MIQKLLRTIGFRSTTAYRYKPGQLRLPVTLLRGEFLEARNLLAASISVVDNSGADDDATIQFTTLLQNGSEANLVRPGLPDDRHYIDVTNTGDAPLTLSEIEINSIFESDVNVFDLSIDIPLTSDPGDDIVLAPMQTQRFTLTFAPSIPNSIDPSNYFLNLADGLIIHSNASNAAALPIQLTATSTFRGDVNYDGKVTFPDIAFLNNTFGKGTGDPEYHPSIDMDVDGIVNFSDFGVFNAEFGRDINNPPPIIGPPPSKLVNDAPESNSNEKQSSTTESDPSFYSLQPSSFTIVSGDEFWGGDDSGQSTEDAARRVASEEGTAESDTTNNSPNSTYESVFEELGGGGSSSEKDSAAILDFDPVQWETLV